MRRYLVVGNQTLEGGELLSEVQERLERGPSRFFILVPASPPRGGLTWTESQGALLAQDRLDRALARFRALGAQVEGVVGDPDPFLAMQDILRAGGFDEIIISTPPRRVSPWLKTDLPRRAESAFGLHVTNVEGAPEQVTSGAVLEGVGLFAGLSKRHLRALARASVIGEYRDGEAIVKAGTSGSDLFVVLDGRVKVRLGRRTVGRMAVGDIFGEISLLDPGPRTADVLADGPTRCLHLSGGDFRTVVEADPKLAIELLRVVGRRMRELVREPIG